MKNVLILSDINFWEDSSGHRARLKALITYLSPRVNLTVVNTGPAPANIENALRESYPAEFHVLEKKNFMSSNGYGRRLEKLMASRMFDAVIIEYIHSSYFLNFLNGEPKTILDVHDIISERAEEFKRFNYAGALYELPAAAEMEILQVYDHVMAICAPDKEKLDEMLGPGKVLLCPHPVHVTPCPLRDEVQNIVFVASSYLPNRDAINHFIRDCWPLVTEKFSQVTLTIYGTVCQGVDRAGHTNILLKGFMSDLGKIYNDAGITINPVRFGAGVKIKNIEALAYGIPLVTTTHGSRGLEAIAGKGFFIADTPTEFAEALGVLIENKQLRVGLAGIGQQFITENFQAEHCFTPLMEAIQKI